MEEAEQQIAELQAQLAEASSRAAAAAVVSSASIEALRAELQASQDRVKVCSRRMSTARWAATLVPCPDEVCTRPSCSTVIVLLFFLAQSASSIVDNKSRPWSALVPWPWYKTFWRRCWTPFKYVGQWYHKCGSLQLRYPACACHYHMERFVCSTPLAPSSPAALLDIPVRSKARTQGNGRAYVFLPSALRLQKQSHSLNRRCWRSKSLPWRRMPSNRAATC